MLFRRDNKRVFVVLLLVAIISTNCSINNDSQHEREKINTINSEVIYKQKQDKKVSDTITVLFEAQFENTDVSVFSTAQELFSGTISTDHRVGVAKELFFKRPATDSLFFEFKLDTGKIHQEVGLRGLNKVYIEHSDEKLTFTLTDIKRYYK